MEGTGRSPHLEAWPELPYDAWSDTLHTLHMNLQIVGKVRLALTPFEPQWANVPLYVTARGLTTTPMAYAGLIFEIDVDLIDHQVLIRTVGGETRRVVLTARPVADFYADFMSNLGALGIVAEFRPSPSEVSDPIPFAEDTVHAMYQPELANRFWRVLSQVDLLEVIAGTMGYQAGGCADGALQVREQVRVLLGVYRHLADHLDLSDTTEPESHMSFDEVRQAELGCLRRLQTDAGLAKGAMAVVMAGEWAQDLARLEADLEGAVNTAVESARKTWWR